MIPPLVILPGSPWDGLPPGVHMASLAEIQAMFGYNPKRRALFNGLLDATSHLAMVGCQRVLLDGSYVSAKPVPGDFDACWDPAGVDFDRLDDVFGDFDNGRANQKARFGGEFFPATLLEGVSGAVFEEFFQVDRFTGRKKGILEIALRAGTAVGWKVNA